MTNETFKLIRLYSGLSQRAFAKKISVGHGTVSMIEGGKRRVTDNVKSKLAAHFDLTPDFFIYLEKMKGLSHISNVNT
ncbi:helix-turn-helix domain-containing protein [Bacillus seohaeanensis]|uniref:Helix-turn-helix domain-containing protein n=1 Tax=Bacillus seohaeanensis TaxID=284580 RepID=A0ABW5RTJ2_9BACI